MSFKFYLFELLSTVQVVIRLRLDSCLPSCKAVMCLIINSICNCSGTLAERSCCCEMQTVVQMMILVISCQGQHDKADADWQQHCLFRS